MLRRRSARLHPVERLDSKPGSRDDSGVRRLAASGFVLLGVAYLTGAQAAAGTASRLPAWKLAFQPYDRRAGGVTGLDVATRARPTPRRLVTGGYAERPMWSRDGQYVAFIRNDHLFVVQSSGRGLVRVSGDGRVDGSWRWRAWSPDGNRLAYATSCPVDDEARCTAPSRIEIVNRDGSGRREVPQYDLH